MAGRNNVAGANCTKSNKPQTKDFLKANILQPVDSRKAKKAPGAQPEQRRASADKIGSEALRELLDDYTASLEAPDEATLLKQQIKEMQRRAERAEAAVDRLSAQLDRQSAQIEELLNQLRTLNPTPAPRQDDAQAEQEVDMEGVAADATSSVKRPLSPSPSTSDAEEEGAVASQGFVTVGKGGKTANKKQRRRSNNAADTPSTEAAAGGSSQVSADAPSAAKATTVDAARQAAPARKRAFAFVLIGLSADQREQLASIHNLLGVSNSVIRRTNIMKSGNIIIEPTDEASRAIIEAATLPANLQLKALDGSSRAKSASQYIVLKGVHEDISAEKNNRGPPATMQKAAVIC